MDRRKTDRRRDPTQEVQIPELREIALILYKRKFLILALMAAPIIFGGLYLKNKPDMYKATASVIVESQELNLGDFKDILAGMKFDNLTVPTQIQVITSPSLVQETIKTLDQSADENKESLYDQTKDFLENLDVAQQGASRVIQISYRSLDPKEAANIANTHAKQYIYAQIKAKKEQAEKINDWVTAQIIELKEESLEKSRAVQKFRSDSGMVLGKNSQELIYQQISDIAAQLTPIETKETDLKARLDLLTTRSDRSLTEVVESSLVQGLKSRLSQASQKLESLRADFGENHPEVIALRKEISQINDDIQKEVTNIRAAIENERAAISKQKELLKAKLAELQKEADALQENQIELQALQIEETASSKLLDNFMARSEEIKSQIDFTRPDVRIVSLADVPSEPAGSKKTILFVAIAMLSGLFAVGTALALEMIDHGIQKREDVKKFLNIKLIGCLAQEKSPITSVLEKEKNHFVEEIKRIYLYLAAQPDSKIIVFTSALKQEGKTTIMMALAYYLQSIGKHTIVIDANTLSPTVAGVTMVPQSPGYFELLHEQNMLSSVITVDKQGLAIIPAGAQSPLSSDLLLAGRLSKPLSVLRSRFDYVFIESAPVLESSDAEVLTQHADQVILVSLWAKTSKKQLKKATEILRQFAKNTPNIILNKLKDADI